MTDRQNEATLRCRCWIALLALLLMQAACAAQVVSTAPAATPARWDLKALGAAPNWTAVEGIDEPGVKAIFYDGLPWKGKPTRIFAWLGLPTNPANAKAPGIVLVHGGGGTSHARWVRLWNERGFAAIAMDVCGKAYGVKEGGAKPLDQGGPPGWDASFEQTDWPREDQWTYQAVADIILANSLLRSMPEVDPAKVGLTGISWGGYLTCIAAAADNRFRFAIPVYGCGFLGEDSVWVPKFQEMGQEKAAKWLRSWDPSVYLAGARVPMLWITGNTDFAYPLSSLQKSYQLGGGDRYLCIKPAMGHNHPAGEKPAEIHAFAQQIVAGGAPLPQCAQQGINGRDAWAVFRSKTPLVKGECIHTADTGPWQQRKWTVAEAPFDTAKNQVSFALPAGTAAYYFNVTDQRGLIASSAHMEIPKP